MENRTVRWLNMTNICQRGVLLAEYMTVRGQNMTVSWALLVDTGVRIVILQYVSDSPVLVVATHIC